MDDSMIEKHPFLPHDIMTDQQHDEPIVAVFSLSLPF
jgi:hypothetical protein